MKKFSGREWLLKRSEGVIKYGLERIEKLLSELDNPQNCFFTVHVAGTNGKGSVTSIIENTLRYSDIKTGMFISPHIDDLRERIRVNGEWIEESELDRAAFEVYKASQRLGDDRPSFFEKIFAIACVHFRNHGVQVGVLEAGLGGRLDATNTSRSEIAVLTNVSADHLKTLGPKISDVLREKSGIIKSTTKHLISGVSRKSHKKYLESRCTETGTQCSFSSDTCEVKLKKSGLSHQEVLVKHDGNITLSKGNADIYNFGLIGAHQRKNLAIAITALDKLVKCGWEIDHNSLRSALKDVKWPGRFEHFSKNPDIILDGAHNLAGAKALLKTLDETDIEEPVMILGMLKDKNVEGVAKLLASRCRFVAVVEPSVQRSLHRMALEDVLKKEGITARSYSRIASAVEAAVKKAGSSGTVVVTGSLYLLGEVREILRDKKIASWFPV